MQNPKHVSKLCDWNFPGQKRFKGVKKSIRKLKIFEM